MGKDTKQLAAIARYHRKQVRIYQELSTAMGLNDWHSYSKRQAKKHQRWVEVIESLLLSGATKQTGEKEK